jgi:hypothetical protein
MTPDVEEFLRRFLLHLLPPGFVRIRNFGFLANRNRATLLPLCFQLLGGSQEHPSTPASPSIDETPLQFGITKTCTPLAASFCRKTCSVAFWNCSGRALGMSVKVCGLRSVRGNQELST